MTTTCPSRPTPDADAGSSAVQLRLTGRIVLITGVSSGLGRAMAREALARGATVVGTVRRREDLDAFESLAPDQAIGRLLDLTDTDAIEQVVASVETDVGAVDTLINNAGYGLAGAVEELPIAQLRHQFEVDVIGQVAMVQAVLPVMRARRSGRIVNIASMGGVVTFPTNGAYHGAKFALLGMSDTLAQELGPLGIAVTAVLPGLYDTDWGGRSRATSPNRIADYERFRSDGAPVEMTGDPARLACVVADLLDNATPPTRLLVGHNAVVLVREELARQNAEIDRWEAVSDTDGDG